MQEVHSDALGLSVIVENDIYPQALAERQFGSCTNVEQFVGGEFRHRTEHGRNGPGPRTGFVSRAGQICFHTHYGELWRRYGSVEYLLSGKGIASQAEALGFSTTSPQVLSHPTTAELLPLQENFFLHVRRLLCEISYFLNPKTIVPGGKALIPQLSGIQERYKRDVDEYSLCSIEVSLLHNSNCLGVLALLIEKVVGLRPSASEHISEVLEAPL